MEVIMSSLTEFRKEKDEFFKDHPQSPLSTEQKKDFEGLNYFEENTNLQMELQASLWKDAQPIQMQTTTGSVQEYFRYARIKFKVEDGDAELTIYKSDHGYFLPFVDALAGKETYPAGRYLDPEELPGDRFLVDFNLAYNPYCAYSDLWSCPITPMENRLDVPIRAGEKLFNH